MLNLKSMSLALVLIASPSVAFAGWGAIAYNSVTGASSESHSYATYNEAIAAALSFCGPGCSIVNWEHNSCNAFATGPGGVWGEGHGFTSYAYAVNEAMLRCGFACTLRQWTCY